MIPSGEPRPAAAVILHSPDGGDKVLLVQRSNQMKFLPGFYAFPGGKVDVQDKQLAPGDSAWDTARVAAARELFEETGVLIARGSEGSCPVANPSLQAARKQLLEGKISFREILEEEKLRICSSDFLPAGVYVTPIFSPLRFQTWFFLCQLPAGQSIEIFTGELQKAQWNTPREFIQLWEQGNCLLSPPVLSLTDFLAGYPHGSWPGQLQERVDRIDSQKDPIRFYPDVQLVPVVCPGPGMPQAGNVYLLGREDFFLVDPGPLDESGLAAIDNALQARKNQGHRLAAILLTHHHPDHVSQARYLGEKEKVPVWAHELTRQLLKNTVTISRTLQDGEVLELPNGAWRNWRVIHTPGHAPGHLIFFNEQSGCLVAGDLVSTVTSIVVGPPEGHLATYLNSLKKALELEAKMLFPFHGPPTLLVREEILKGLEHREKREQALLERLSRGRATVAILAKDIYRGLSSPLLPAASKQVQGGLIKLLEEGQVRCLSDGGQESWELVE
ncbi:MAG: MBL fold metallo-hydrolase [Gemmataceae bacterium]|nr:MBL fold metallo-hydrolase [Gemmataceae bacterium]